MQSSQKQKSNTRTLSNVPNILNQFYPILSCFVMFFFENKTMSCRPTSTVCMVGKNLEIKKWSKNVSSTDEKRAYIS